MKKKMTVTLEVDVADISAAELKENAELCQCKVKDLPRLADVAPVQIADSIAGSLDINEELFAGSEMYIRVTGARVVAADWK